MEYKILHTADIQVNIRDKNLKRSFEKALENIYNIVRDQKISIYTIVGDLFEYAMANEAETKIMYYHLSKIITLDCVKELVIMAGNHDLVKEKRVSENQEDENKINTFFHTLSALNTKHAHKINYLKFSTPVRSKATDSLLYIPYSLEDDMLMLDKDVHEIIESTPAYPISFFHDILKDYAIQTKLPLQKQKLESLVSVDDFKTRFILAGDIHVYWDCVGENGQQFFYPGSPIQRNFGEGEYIKIGNDSLDIKGDQKKLRVFSFDDQRLIFKQEEPILLPDYVSYVTIEILKDISFDVAYRSITDMLDSITFGEEQTFIKLKLSNLFLSHEMDFHKLITTKTSGHKRVQLEISYDKFINTQLQTNISKILTPDSTDEQLPNTDGTIQVATEDAPSGIDSLILDSNKLRKLFLYVLDSRMEKLIKEFPNDNPFIEKVYQETVGIFDDQLNDCLSEMKKTNIEFENIECNSFMILGSNTINLKVPGITRISGTNGIGKTTLYNMLRWIIRNEIYEGMPKNRVKQNTMGVFNNKNPEQDTVIVKLRQRVNTIPVTITRTATRIWKRNVTDEQKISLNWQEYIQNISTELCVEVDGKNGIRQFIGDQAQQYIDSWFGKTPETILFLNYGKILSILNTPPKELNETVLNFIGVDYLKTLEQNVEAVKMNLLVEKPKRTKDVVLDDITTNKTLIESIKEISKSNKTSLDDIDKHIVGFTDSLKNENEKLIKLGDHPNIVKTNQSTINELTVEIDEFVVKTIKELEAFTEQEPEEYNSKTDDELLEDAIVSLNTYELESENKTKQLNDKCVLLEEKYKSVIDQLTDIEKQNNNSQQEVRESIRKTQADIDKIKTNISSSVCSECKRPFNSIDEYEQKKIEWEKQLKFEESKIDGFHESMVAFNDKAINITTAIKLTREKLNKLLKHDFLYSEESKQCKELFVEIVNLSRELDINVEDVKTTQLEVDRLKKVIVDKNAAYLLSLKQFHSRKSVVDEKNKQIEADNKIIEIHNNSINDLRVKLEIAKKDKEIIDAKKPDYDRAIASRQEFELAIEAENKEKIEIQAQINKNAAEKIRVDNLLEKLETEVENIYRFNVNNTIFKLYNTLIKDDFKGIVFEYYRNFLNNELNNLLEDVNFKLFWNADNELFMVKMENGVCSYTPVQQTSGMEVVFLGLSLIYTMSILNIRNSISTIFIDELSGQLNKGDQLGYKARDYQELFVNILAKFTNKQVVIVDHNIRNLYETVNYEVEPGNNGSIYTIK